MSAVTGDVAAARLNAQLLVRPVDRVEEVVHRLLAVQGQDPRAFRLAIRSRTHGCTAADVDDALNSGALIVTWLCRGTLHLVQARDYPWLHALTAPRIVTTNDGRLARLGVDPPMADRGVAVVTETLADGPRSRAELRTALHAAGVPVAGQALVHVLVAASLREYVVRGPMREGEHCFVDARQWLGNVEPPDRDTCLAQLAQRYLVAHAPAAPQDLAAYAGITLTDARRAFDMVGSESPAPHAGDFPPPRLLGMFDPVLHGWADRSFVTGPYTDVVTNNGLFRATALVDGRVAGTWKLNAGTPTLATFQPLSAATRAALEAEAVDVLRFLGLPSKPLAIEPA